MLVEFAVPARRGAQGVVGVDFHHRQLQPAAALHLHDQRAVKFQIGRQQRASRQQFAQQVAQARRVGVVGENFPPGLVQPDQRPAHRGLVEQKTLQHVVHE